MTALGRSTTATVIRRDGGRCFLCGLAEVDTVDQVRSVADGGDPSDLNNLAAAHARCVELRAGRPVKVASAELQNLTRQPGGWSW